MTTNFFHSLRNLWQAQQKYYCRSAPRERPEVYLEVSMSQTNRCRTGKKDTKITMRYDDYEYNDMNDMPNVTVILILSFQVSPILLTLC